MSLDDRLVDAWREAANDLGIRVVAPYLLRLPSGEEVACEAFIPDFGSTRGAIVLSEETERRERRALGKGDDLWTSVHPVKGTPRKYDRAAFIDELTDFGWFGQAEEAPSWYPSPPIPSRKTAAATPSHGSHGQHSACL